MATFVRQSNRDGAPPRRQDQTATFYGNSNVRTIRNFDEPSHHVDTQSKKRRGNEETDSDSNESGDMETETKKNQDENSVREQVCLKAPPRRGFARVMSLLPQTGEGTEVQMAIGTTEVSIVSSSIRRRRLLCRILAKE